MALDKDEILVDNLRESLNFYQRSLVWAMTASAAFYVLTLSPLQSISVLYGQLSGTAASLIALGLFFVLGILAGSALRNAEAVLSEMQVDSRIRDATLLYPSLATNTNGFIRIGTVLFCPITVWIAFGVELRRESATAGPRDVWWWSGLAWFFLLTAVPYADIASRLWHKIGSRRAEPAQPVGGARGPS
jgi:hypothetical protein